VTLQPCPNEECRGECRVDTAEFSRVWQVFCERNCGYTGPAAANATEAIELHNRMPRTEPWVSVAERMPELGMRCELIHSDPTEPVLVLTIAESEFAAYDHGFESLGALSRGIYTHWRPYREPPRPPTP
jgi:hypothetical protein